MKNCIAPRINAPCHAGVANILGLQLNPQIRSIPKFQPVECCEHTRSGLERFIEVQLVLIYKLGLIADMNVRDAERTRCDIGTIGRVSNPRDCTGVQYAITPCINMDDEAGVGNVGCGGVDPPVVGCRPVQCVNPDYNLRYRSVRLGKLNVTGSG